MRLCLGHRPSSQFAWALYLVCFAFVLSFILFEVLDIDGSDFAPRPNTTATPAGLSEASHDIRRAFLTEHVRLRVELPPNFTNAPSEVLRRLRPALQQSRPYGFSRQRAYSIILPRASLPDPSHRS